jgi:hypothetical protein
VCLERSMRVYLLEKMNKRRCKLLCPTHVLQHHVESWQAFYLRLRRQPHHRLRSVCSHVWERDRRGRQTTKFVGYTLADHCLSAIEYCTIKKIGIQDLPTSFAFFFFFFTSSCSTPPSKQLQCEWIVKKRSVGFLERVGCLAAEECCGGVGEGAKEGFGQNRKEGVKRYALGGKEKGEKGRGGGKSRGYQMSRLAQLVLLTAEDWKGRVLGRGSVGNLTNLKVAYLESSDDCSSFVPCAGTRRR